MGKILALLAILLVAPVLAHTDGPAGPAGVTLNASPVVGEPRTIFIPLVENENAVTKDQLEIAHERLLHVFIVGEDLQTFTHTHPEDFNGFAREHEGIYNIEYTFPKSGMYAVIAEYTVDGEGHEIISNVLVPGERMQQNIDFTNKKQFGAYDVTLQQPAVVPGGREVEFTYSIAKNNQPVRNLALYLGSEIHMLAIRSDLQEAGHTHAYAEHTGHHAAMQMYTGPTIPVRYTFNEPGVYALFAQFKAGEEIVTTQFMVNVTETEISTHPETPAPKNVGFLALIGAVLMVLVVAAILVGQRKKR